MKIKYPMTPRIPILSVAAAAVAASPTGTAAQESLRHHDVRALSAAVEEARRSPFHAGIAADAPLALRPAGHLSAHSLREVARTTADNRPPFGGVFIPVLAATCLADLVGFVALFNWAYGGSGALLAVASTGAVVVPGLIAGAITKRYKQSFLGSLIGTVGATLVLFTVDVDNVLALGLAPVVDAVATTAFGLYAR